MSEYVFGSEGLGIIPQGIAPITSSVAIPSSSSSTMLPGIKETNLVGEQPAINLTGISKIGAGTNTMLPGISPAGRGPATQSMGPSGGGSDGGSSSKLTLPEFQSQCKSAGANLSSDGTVCSYGPDAVKWTPEGVVVTKAPAAGSKTALIAGAGVAAIALFKLLG